MSSIPCFSPSHFPFPMHSVHIWHKGQLLQESYYAPYEKGTPHRMFSITKSYTSLAIGALIAEHRLHLDDRICELFPEYTPADASAYLTDMTLRDMLSMRTCHKATTYKLDASAHWVRSFFTTPPDHCPGRIFKYDTSSAHTLAALVQKRSGKGVLDYLRGICLDQIGHSAQAHILTDPFGCEIGGSGLIATPEDLLALARLLLSLYRGSWERDYPDLIGCADSSYDHAFWQRYADYVRAALSYQTATLHEGKTLDERQGYGYQFWRVRDGGVMMYGMGGQYVVLYPDAELIFITTADTQSIQGGTQYILDEIHRVALALAPSLAAPTAETPAFPASLLGSWRLSPNKTGWQTLTLSDTELTLESAERRFVLPYGRKSAIRSRDAVYGQTLYTRALPQPDGSLYLRADILDDYVGSLHLLLSGSGDTLTLYLRKVEESLYSEFNGFYDGTRA